MERTIATVAFSPIAATTTRSTDNNIIQTSANLPIYNNKVLLLSSPVLSHLNSLANVFDDPVLNSQKPIHHSSQPSPLPSSSPSIHPQLNHNTQDIEHHSGTQETNLSVDIDNIPNSHQAVTNTQLGDQPHRYQTSSPLSPPLIPSPPRRRQTLHSKRSNSKDPSSASNRRNSALKSSANATSQIYEIPPDTPPGFWELDFPHYHLQNDI